MGAFRNFLRSHRGLVALLTALALAMKVLIPAGYMLDRNATVPMLVICPDASPATVLEQKQAPHSAHAGHHMGGKPGHAPPDHGSRGKHDSGGACPYSVLPMASLAAADAPLLAIALAFVLALGFAPVPVLRLARSFHLRPPLRGPPALI